MSENSFHPNGWKPPKNKWRRVFARPYGEAKNRWKATSPYGEAGRSTKNLGGSGLNKEDIMLNVDTLSTIRDFDKDEVHSMHLTGGGRPWFLVKELKI